MHKQQKMPNMRALLARVAWGVALGAACTGAQADDAVAAAPAGVEPVAAAPTVTAADTAAGDPDAAEPGSVVAAEPAVTRAPSPLAGRVLADDELNGRRGGAATQNDMRLDGVVGSNEATNTVSGANTISSGAFAGSAGLPMVIQNSGNNVLIQNATIVNVQIK